MPFISSRYCSMESVENAALRAHEPPGPMRGGAVPLRVSFSDTDKAAVPHIDGNEQLFALLGRNRAFCAGSSRPCRYSCEWS